MTATAAGQPGSSLGRLVALYYFHLCDGRDTLVDPEGQEIADAARIGDCALKEARAMISQDALGGRIKLDHHAIEVRDVDGKLIHQLAFRDAVTIG
ncbi:MAG: DUF6894 family protein [Sphingomicrobium sp.]